MYTEHAGTRVVGSQESKAIPVPSPEKPFVDFDLRLSGKEVSEERSAREKLDLLRKIATIASVFSRNYRMQVLPAPEHGWYCSISVEAVTAVNQLFKGDRVGLQDLAPEIFKPYRIFYDTEDIAHAPERVVLGILRHEVGHARHTDFRLFFEGQQFARSQGYLRTSWATIANALEDPWVNNLEMADSDVVREQLEASYAHEYDEILKRINDLPPTLQLGLNINHYWLTGQSLPTLKSQEVREVFDKMRPLVDRYFTGASALENYQLLRDEIWPIYKDLEKKGIEEEARQQLSRRIIRIHIGSGGGMPLPGGKTGQPGDDIFISLDGNGGGQGGDLDQELQKALGDLDPATKAELKKAIEQKLKELAKQRSGNPADRLPGNEGNFDLSTLSPNLRNTVDRLGKALSNTAQQQLERSAREVLDEKHARALEQSAPVGMAPRKNSQTGEYEVALKNPLPEEEARKTEERIQQLAAQLERQLEQAAKDLSQPSGASTTQIRNALKDLRLEQEMQRSGFSPEERTAFLHFKALERAMQREVDAIIRDLEKILPKKSERFFEGHFYSGHRIDIKKLINRAPVGRTDFHLRRSVIYTADPRLYVQLLIDRSGSMHGAKMNEALKTAIFWGRVCERFNVPFAVKFFAHNYVRVKDFEQDYNDPGARIKPNIVLLSDASGGSTNIGAPLSVAFEEMKEARRRYQRFMGATFVITDSGANDGLSGDPLRALIARMQEDFVVGASILSGEAEDARISRWYFGDQNVVAPANFSALPRESFRILRQTIMSFARRFGEGNI